MILLVIVKVKSSWLCSVAYETVPVLQCTIQNGLISSLEPYIGDECYRNKKNYMRVPLRYRIQYDNCSKKFNQRALHSAALPLGGISQWVMIYDLNGKGTSLVLGKKTWISHQYMAEWSEAVDSGEYPEEMLLSGSRENLLQSSERFWYIFSVATSHYQEQRV